MPSLDQSRRKHVRQLGSKKGSMPERIASTKANLASRNALSNSLDYSNFRLEPKNGLNGAIRSRSWAYLVHESKLASNIYCVGRDGKLSNSVKVFLGETTTPISKCKILAALSKLELVEIKNNACAID